VPHKFPSSAARTRVLLLTDSFLPHAGGSREYYSNIYRSLVELGDSEVTILTKKVPGWQEFDLAASTEFFHIKRRFKPLTSTKYHELPRGVGPFLDAAWQALRYSPAIVHAGDLYPPGLTAMILKRVLGIPYVVYCHGEEITQLDRYRYQPLIRDRIYKSADAVVAASEFARQNLQRIGVEDRKICKITPAVHADRFGLGLASTGLLQRYDLAGKSIVLTVARLVQRKGHRIVLQALSKICNEIPNVHYVIVGTGPEESNLRRLVQQSGLAERVTFAGYVLRDELPGFYSLCDVMVMPNRQEEDGDLEGFGMVFLEASAAGKPVIGGRTGGANEAIAEGITGFLVNPDDPDELAVTLRRLLLNRELRDKLGEAGAQRARADFDWKSRAEALHRVNHLILSGHDVGIGSEDRPSQVSGHLAAESAAARKCGS
jgi:phosphatidylinositol alpha-1,6-mannosyltransferase